MTVENRILESVEADSDLGRIICCALYLNAKMKNGEIGGSIPEQVALEILRGNYVTETISKVIHFDEAIVKDALLDIAAFCGTVRE